MKRLAGEGHVFTATEKLYPNLAGNPVAHYDWKLKSGSPFSTSTFNPEAGGCVMMKMLEEAKVTVLYDTVFVDAVTKKLPGSENNRGDHYRKCVREASDQR